jgi:hypothetical protein
MSDARNDIATRANWVGILRQKTREVSWVSSYTWLACRLLFWPAGAGR